MQAQKGGQALKRAIRTARERAGIRSDVQLAREAGVSYDTLMNWYGERVVPRPSEVRKVANAIHVPLASLMDAYEGIDSEPPTLVDALKELVEQMRAANETQQQLIAELRQEHEREQHQQDPPPSPSRTPQERELAAVGR